MVGHGRGRCIARCPKVKVGSHVDGASHKLTPRFDAEDADASGYEPVWRGGVRVGYVTSGGYGHYTGKSLALALVDTEHAGLGTELTAHVVGVERGARIIEPSPHDPAGARMRS